MWCDPTEADRNTKKLHVCGALRAIEVNQLPGPFVPADMGDTAMTKVV